MGGGVSELVIGFERPINRSDTRGHGRDGTSGSGKSTTCRESRLWNLPKRGVTRAKITTKTATAAGVRRCKFFGIGFRKCVGHYSTKPWSHIGIYGFMTKRCPDDEVCCLFKPPSG